MTEWRHIVFFSFDFLYIIKNCTAWPGRLASNHQRNKTNFNKRAQKWYYSNLPRSRIYFCRLGNTLNGQIIKVMGLSVFFVCNLCCNDLFQRDEREKPVKWSSWQARFTVLEATRLRIGAFVCVYDGFYKSRTKLNIFTFTSYALKTCCSSFACRFYKEFPTLSADFSAGFLGGI